MLQTVQDRKYEQIIDDCRRQPQKISPASLQADRSIRWWNGCATDLFIFPEVVSTPANSLRCRLNNTCVASAQVSAAGCPSSTRLRGSTDCCHGDMQDRPGDSWEEVQSWESSARGSRICGVEDWWSVVNGVNWRDWKAHNQGRRNHRHRRQAEVVVEEGEASHSAGRKTRLRSTSDQQEGVNWVEIENEEVDRKGRKSPWWRRENGEEVWYVLRK